MEENNNLKNMLSKLKASQMEQGRKFNQKTLTTKPNFSYRVRLLPYMGDELNSFKEVYYHFINNKKVMCGSKYCKHCQDGSKKTMQRLVNVKLLETDDPFATKFVDLTLIYNVNYSLLQKIDKYEKDNLTTIFDIYSAPELIIKPTMENNYITYKESFVGTDFKPIASNINSYEDDVIIHYLKNFTFNLDEEVATMFELPLLLKVEEEIDVEFLEEINKVPTKKRPAISLEKKESVVDKSTQSEQAELVRKAKEDDIGNSMDLALKNIIDELDIFGESDKPKQSEQAELVRKKEPEKKVEVEKKPKVKTETTPDDFIADFMKDIVFN